MIKYDRSLLFGVGRFLWVKTDATDPTYDYSAFISKQGSILIMKYKKDDTEGLYWLGKGTFTSIWSLKATYTYLLPNQLADQTFDI